MNTENSSIILAQALEQQTRVMLCMLDALREEHRTLSSADLESFERSVRNKQDQVTILEQTQAQLGALTPILNGKFSKTTIVSYIGKLPAGSQRSQLESLWDTLQKTTRDCSEQNIINNRIMDASSTHLRQAISILRGDLSGPTVNVYGASGRQKANSNGQSLATA
ncbi:MAG: flagellar protein FlgN [Gammaproteobacteria bacterium]|nr:flagellar protein FlgN [Gammaproteobacteria bacterium]